MTTIFFTSLFCGCFWIRDPGSGMGKNQDPGSGINIPDPQHWYHTFFQLVFWIRISFRNQNFYFGAIIVFCAEWRPC